MTLTVDGQVRTYRLAVPSTYRSGRPTPLLLLFHGSGSTALQTSLYTGLPAVAARAGMLVATPDAEDGNWMLSRPGASTPDLDFVAALISSLSHRYCVDRHRVVAAGISLGSEFAVVVGCTTSLHLAAIGLVAAEYVLSPCSGPLPVLAFHGTADPIVAYANGGTGSDLPGVHVIGVQRNLAGWARIDHCRPRPLRRTVARSVILQTWRGCEGGSSVGLYTVVGGGHTWPGSPIVLPVARFGATTERIDASALLVRFFERAAPRRS
jgi:polyhydroxybutyrate depolymerase